MMRCFLAKAAKETIPEEEPEPPKVDKEFY